MKIAKLDLWVREKEDVTSLTRREIERIQLEKLNQLLRRERARCGFYKNLPDKLESLNQLSQLPFTTEEDLKEHGNRMLLLSQSQVDRVRTEETSGTTGLAKRLFYSEKDNERTISFFAAGLSELVYPGEKTMICMPFSGYHGLGELIAEAVIRLGAVPISAGIGKKYSELLDILEEQRPETFIGMPVPLLSLLRLHPKGSLQRALLSADACPDAVMAGIESILKTKLYPHYGSRELGLGGAVTCPAFKGMHLRENDVIPEIIGKEGQTLPNGEWGELVITTIQADAMPLIRYRTGDYTRILRQKCPCGSELCRLDRISRIGRKPSMEELDDLFLKFPEVIDYRAAWSPDKKTLEIDGYLLDKCKALPSEWQGHRICYHWRSVRGTDMPCYAAKRRIMEQR